jgi:serine protease
MKRLLILGIAALFIFSSVTLAENFKIKSFSDKSVLKGEVEYVPGEVLVKFKEGISLQKVVDLESTLGTSVLSNHSGGVKKLSVPAGKTEQELISILKQDPRVEYAELNTICHAFMTPNDPYYSPYQWNFPKVNCPSAWDISTGTGVVVAILDAGIAYENYAVPSYESGTVQSGVTSYVKAPDLAGTAFTSGYDFINGDTHPNDNNGHGTHVAGTVAQTTNNSYGVAGMAFGCTLMPVKVLNYTGSGTAQTLADGLYWATDNGARVINMSLGWPSGYNPGSTVQNAITYAYNHGVVLVASSGNEGVSTVSYPAAYSQVIAVGATRYDDQLAYYSQYGSAQELVAPGGDLNVDQNGDGYGDGILQQSFDPYDPGPPVVLANPTSFSWWFYIGTSQAAPHVSALVAMMIANGQTGIENIRTILHETAVDLGSSGWDQTYGYGRINAYAALTYGEAPPVANFSGTPTSGAAPLTDQFTDLSTNSPTSWSWNFGDGDTSAAQNPSHTYSLAGDYTVSLTVANAYGSDSEIKTNYIHVDTPGVAKSYANQDIPVTGTVFGNYTNTFASDNIYESITEVSSGGKPSSRYSILEHKWTFDVTAGETITFYVEAYRPANSDNDNFRFEYSRDDVTYYHILTVNSASELVYSAEVPNTLSGTVYVRVVDTDRIAGRLSYDVIYIDEMYFESVGTPPPPGKMHVDHIDVATSTTKNRTRGIGDVWVVDALGNPVADATVYGTWQGLNSTSGVTNAQGKATLESSQVRNACQWFKFCVDNISKSGWTYDSGANVETCDSSYYCGAAKLAGIPADFSLSQNSPNPFNLSTSIFFFLPTPSEVDLTIYNILGEKVKTVAQGWLEAGSHTVTWDGTNESGSVVASGIYFYKLNAGDQVVTKKMSLLK